MFLKPQVCVEYGNRTREHLSGHQSSYWLWTSVFNFSERELVSHTSPPYPKRRLNQYKEDDFYIKVLISNKLFSNYKFTRKIKAVYVDVYPLCLCWCVSILFMLMRIHFVYVDVYPFCLKTWYTSKFNSKVVFTEINIYDKHCIYIPVGRLYPQSKYISS